MASEELTAELKLKIANAFKAGTNVVKNAFYTSATDPDASAISKLFVWLKAQNGRYVIKFKTDDAPTYKDVHPYEIVSDSLDTRYNTISNFGTTATSSVMRGIRLQAASINSDTIGIAIPAAYVTDWSSATRKYLDESLSFFENTQTGEIITFSSMYHYGMELVKLTTDSVVLQFASGSTTTLSDWKCELAVKYVE